MTDSGPDTVSDGQRFLEALYAAGNGPGDPAQTALAGMIADLLDEIGALRDRIAADGPIVEGSKGGPVPHPALAQVRLHRVALAKLLSQLAAPGASSAARAMNRKRWSGR